VQYFNYQLFVQFADYIWI